MYLKGLDPGTCEIIWSYISAESYAGQIFGLACVTGPTASGGFSEVCPSSLWQGGSAGPASPACSTAVCRSLL